MSAEVRNREGVTGWPRYALIKRSQDSAAWSPQEAAWRPVKVHWCTGAQREPTPQSPHCCKVIPPTVPNTHATNSPRWTDQDDHNLHFTPRK